ncbi:MAG: hypothetical protein JRF59_07365 [Deltaproteobacteria bacterium]|nr:hypothetical protein [Deltaproteobacteria bacterium]MBW1923471.1 hypothetical protein [Deltaproteobacteria bacterium]MBW1948664.1 hypothetical protein [Deltaproteobacteria bacterium]MBW2007234.1 hypothetical protein [Deltaproteobacteria bacterium]MBW2101591.1 hypothetical protein [Deltaproteobacteria bacterium]
MKAGKPHCYAVFGAAIAGMQQNRWKDPGRVKPARAQPERDFTYRLQNQRTRRNEEALVMPERQGSGIALPAGVHIRRNM